MTLAEIQKKLESTIEQSQVTIEGDGCNCSAVVVSPIFEGLSLLQRQRIVLTVMNTVIPGLLTTSVLIQNKLQ